MSIQHISSNAIIGTFIRDFNPQNLTFEIAAIEWIGEALDIMKLSTNSVHKHAKIVIDSSRTRIPCDVEEILGINVVSIDGANVNSNHFEVYNGNIPIEHISKSISNIDFKWYQVKQNFIHFKFETGIAYIYYLGIPVDECGYPLVPDDAKVSAALTWYILMKWLMQGNTHPVFNYEMAEQRWINSYPAAQNSVKAVTPERMAKVLRNWTQLIPRINRHEDFFTEQRYYQSLDNVDFDISQFTAPSIQ